MVLSLGLLILLMLFIVLWRISPGRPDSFRDAEGNMLPYSLAEKVFIEIGGIRQGMFIKSKDSTHPVLLFLHGGMPEYFLAERYARPLEDHFTVVYWEQRGSGLSYSPSIPPETMTLPQMVKDVIEVTGYLKQRFGVEKVYLMAHSGGTFIGIHAANTAPGLFHAYIGVAQMSDQLTSERLAHAFMLERYKDEGNNRMVKKLRHAPVEDNTPDAYLRLRDKAMHELGIGTMRDMTSVVRGIFIPSWTSRSYTLKEKFNLWKGKSESGVSALWKDMVSVNLMNNIRALEIPVYFISGRWDYTVSFSLSADYFRTIQAPIKGFYIFEESAHSPMFEETTKFIQILKTDVLAGKNALADMK